jgi:hypothetical protein
MNSPENMKTKTPVAPKVNPGQKIGRLLSTIFLSVFTVLTIGLAVLVVYEYHQSLWPEDTLTPAGLLFVFVPLLVFCFCNALGCGLYLWIDGGIHHQKVIFPIIMLTLLSLSAMGSIGGAVYDHNAYNEAYTYSPEKWAAAKNYERYRMWPSFESQHNLYGADQTTVVSYLGKPDRSETTATNWVYDLGPDGLGVDNMLLSVYFSSDALVTGYSLWQS